MGDEETAKRPVVEPVRYYNGEGKVVGEVRDGWLAKRVDPSRHQLQNPTGYAVDWAHVERMYAEDVLGVLLVTTGGEHLYATKDAICARGIRIDRGHGEQMVLPMQWWWPTAAEAKRASFEQG